MRAIDVRSYTSLSPGTNCVLRDGKSPTMKDRDEVAEAAAQIAAVIARRDLGTIRTLLAPSFVHRTHGSTGIQSRF